MEVALLVVREEILLVSKCFQIDVLSRFDTSFASVVLSFGVGPFAHFGHSGAGLCVTSTGKIVGMFCHFSN